MDQRPTTDNYPSSKGAHLRERGGVPNEESKDSKRLKKDEKNS